ncbi:hypothetical protein [Myceligenerans cantabricum]
MKHGSGSRWLLEQIRWEIEHQTTSDSKRIRQHAMALRNSWNLHPFTWSSFVQASVFLVAWASGVITLFPSIPAVSIEDPSAAIVASWQVLAGFASIAFAGLAVLMQLTSEPVVTSRGVRQVLFEESQFRPVLAFSITGAIQVGAAALFLTQPESAVVEFAIVALTILWIGRSYARVGRVYASPGEALRLGEEALLRDLRASMREAHARAVAETRLHAIVQRDWHWSSTATLDGKVVVTADRSGTLADVDIDLLADIVRDIAGEDASAFTASDAPSGPGVPSTESAPELRIMFAIGSLAEAGQEIFLLKNLDSFTGDLSKLQTRLENTIRWAGRS